MGIFLLQLGVLDDVLDVLLLLAALLVVAPPHGPFVFTLEAEVAARSAARLALIALLSSKPASKAALTHVSLAMRAERESCGKYSPDLERRCILDDADADCFASAAILEVMFGFVDDMVGLVAAIV
jgi:hypothetical protein